MRGTKYAWLLVTLIAVGCGESGIDQAVDELQDIDDAVCVHRIDRGEVFEACISD